MRRTVVESSSITRQISLEVAAFNELERQLSLFFYRKDVNDLLEILEQIRKAEEKNEQQMQVLRTEMQQLTKKKEDEIHVIEERKRQELTQLLSEKKQIKEATLQTKQKQLDEEIQQVQQTLAEQYAEHQEHAIDLIIERVKEYVRH